MRHDLDDDELEVPDGGVVRVPMMVMDSMQRRIAFDARNHQPGYRYASDAAVRDARRAALDARDAMVKRAANAWKKNGDDDDDDDDDELDNTRSRRTDARSISDARAAARASYVAMVARLGDAWRGSPGRDGAGGPDAEELLRRHLGGGDDDDDNAQARRNEAYRNYTNGLSNAWKMSPARADVVERRLERERGKQP